MSWPAMTSGVASRASKATSLIDALSLQGGLSPLPGEKRARQGIRQCIEQNRRSAGIRPLRSN